MSYVLIAVDGETAPRRLGHFKDYRSAELALAEDLLQVLLANGGWRVRVEHQIIGPGRDGPQTVHQACAELGTHRADSDVPDPVEVATVRRWLLHTHDLNS